MRVNFGPAEIRMFRVDGRDYAQFWTPKSWKERPLARLPNWEEQEWSAAQALQPAAELAFHVGIEAHGDIIFCGVEDVYVLPYKDSIGEAEDDCRFVWVSSCDDSDVEEARP